MAGLTSLLKPSRLIRRKATYSGLLGPSKFWKVVAVFIFGRQTLSKFFGKQTEVIDARSLGAGTRFHVETSKPLSRRQRRKLKKSGRLVPLKQQQADAQVWAAAVANDKLAARSPKFWQFWKR